MHLLYRSIQCLHPWVAEVFLPLKCWAYMYKKSRGLCTVYSENPVNMINYRPMPISFDLASK